MEQRRDHYPTEASALDYRRNDSEGIEPSNPEFSSGVLGTKSRGLLDDDDEEEAESNLDVERIQNFSNFAPPGEMRPGGMGSDMPSLPSSSRPDSSNFAPSPHRSHERGGLDARGPFPTNETDAISEGDAVAFGMVVDESNGVAFGEDRGGHSSSSSAHLRTTPPRSRPETSPTRGTHDDEAPMSSSRHAAAARTNSGRNLMNHSTSFESEQTPLDSAMRRARNSMLAFQKKESPTMQLKPEELKPQPCPIGPQEPVLSHKTSRRCLERIRRKPGERHPATLVTGEIMRKRPSRQEQERFMCVGCENCQNEILVEKTAVVVACPECRSVTAATDTTSVAG